MNPDKRRINDKKAEEMVEALSTPYGRMKLTVDMMFPFERIKYIGETEEQRVHRLFAVLEREEEQRQQRGQHE